MFLGAAFKLAHFQTLFLFFGMGLYLSCFHNLPSFFSSIFFVFLTFITLNAMVDEIFTMEKDKKAFKTQSWIKRSNA